MKCFYHGDLDGKASAFCVHAWVGIHEGNTPIPDNEFISIDYDMLFPFDSIDKDEQIWIVDFSLCPADMLTLLDITEDVTWIDHHKTAIEKINEWHDPDQRQRLLDVAGVRKVGEAACTLTFKYIHWWSGRGDAPFKPFIDHGYGPDTEIGVPRCLQLVADRDVWTWEFGDETRNFYAASQAYDTAPDSCFWWHCMDHELAAGACPGNVAGKKQGQVFWKLLMSQGSAINDYRMQFYGELATHIGFSTSLPDYGGHHPLPRGPFRSEDAVGYLSVFAVNAAHVSSDLFPDQVEEYDILSSFYHNGKQWTISLYSREDGPDVSVIAKRLGGGGHAHAAGFQCDELPYGCVYVKPGVELIETPIAHEVSSD